MSPDKICQQGNPDKSYYDECRRITYLHLPKGARRELWLLAIHMCEKRLISDIATLGKLLELCLKEIRGESIKVEYKESYETLSTNG